MDSPSPDMLSLNALIAGASTSDMLASDDTPAAEPELQEPPADSDAIMARLDSGTMQFDEFWFYFTSCPCGIIATHRGMALHKEVCEYDREDGEIYNSD